MHDEDFCFNRLTVTGRVSQLGKQFSDGVCLLRFDLTIERAPRPTKVLRAIGEIWDQSLALVESIQEGSTVKVIGCLKPVDLAATRPLHGFDLEQLLEVR